MEEIEIHCEYLRRRENLPDEYEHQTIKCPQRERILTFRARVASAFQVVPDQIKLINRGKLVDTNPILSLIDVGINQHNTVFVLEKEQKAPSMTRRRPQSAATPFLPHSPPEMPNVIRMPSGQTLTELSVNRYSMTFVYTEPLCTQGELDVIIRTLAESFRGKYKVDVDVQRRNGQPYEGDMSFDISFKAPPIMPSGAYNRYEAIKTLLIRQKLFITVAEKHLIDQIENPQPNTLPTNFDETVLQEIERVEKLELFCNSSYFPDDVSNEKMNQFILKLESEVGIDEVPLLGNVLQVQHLVPTDYYNILDISQQLDQEAYRLTNLQRNLFNNDQIVDPKVADIFTVLLRRIHHLQAHIQHIFSEISLRTNDTLRVAYPQGTLSTYSGLNPDITFTITFITTQTSRNISTKEMNSGRFTSFHQVHLARPVIRANVAVEVEMGTMNENGDIQRMQNGGGGGNNRPRTMRPTNGPRAPNATPYTRQSNFAFRSGGVNGNSSNNRQQFPRISGTFTNRQPNYARYSGPPRGPPRFSNIPNSSIPIRVPPPSAAAPPQYPSLNIPPGVPFPRLPFIPGLSSSPTVQSPGGSSTTQSPLSSASNASSTEGQQQPGRSLRELLSSMQSQQIEIGTPNGPRVTMNSNEALNPLNSIFRAMDSNGSTSSNIDNNSTQDEEDGTPAAIIIGTTNQSSDDSDVEDFARVLQAAIVSQRGGFNNVMNNQPGNGQMPPNGPARFSFGPRMAGMHPQPHIHHAHGHGHQFGGIPVHVQPLRPHGSNNDSIQRQMRNLGPNGGCPIAYNERIVPANLENHATAQEISIQISDQDLIPCIQRYPFERSVLRRNMNEFVATSLEGLEMILKAYMQGIVSYNTGRQIAHPAITNELASQGHRIQVRKPSPRDRVIEFYRLMGSQDLSFISFTFKTNTFLEDRGFLGTIVLTILHSIDFENIPHLLLNPYDLGILRSSIKKYVIKKYRSDDVDKIVGDVKEKLYNNFYHYLMNVTPFNIVRNDKDMVGSLRKMDGEMLNEFYKLVFDESSDEEFGKALMDLIRTYHSSLISFCYIASNGFPHAYREFLRHIFLDFPTTSHQQTDFAIDVFMESLVNLGLSFDVPNNLLSINTENVSKYILAVGETPLQIADTIGSFGNAVPPTRIDNIDTTASTSSTTAAAASESRGSLLPLDLLDEDVE